MRGRPHPAAGVTARRRAHRLHPAAALVASFAAAILAGTTLLLLPASSTREPLSPLDALFTATSAVCVTGLTVVDTGTRLSPFGQAVVLALVQAGGLGIMTFAVFFALLTGRQISFRDRLVIQDSLHHSPTAELRRLVRHILALTFAVEAVGAGLLWLRFRSEFAPARALYVSAFHSISAFCNAGFALFPDSFTRYRGDPWLTLVLTGLVVAGGLGFLVNMELRDQVRLRWRGQRAGRLTLHTRLVLVVTAGLLAAGGLSFLVLEWGNLLLDLPLGEKLLASWFHAVTPRTAGFNTVDYGRARAATLFLTVLLMFVGASPGSTGGGIKTTSLGLLLALAWARWTGRERTSLFRCTLPESAINRALAVTLTAWAVSSAGLMLLLLAEQGPRPHDETDPRFLALMFEAVSAFGTVGLSTGVTPSLSGAGRVVVILLMLVGRVGPLTAALAIGRRRAAPPFRYAEENVMVG
jgi:trk system potassium uptake protein TrkH